MTTGLLITNAGQAAIAADLGGGANLSLTHVAFGDANGVPYNPAAAQTSLVNERYRSTIASVAVLANEIIVDAVIPADTNDALARPSHGFNVAECGLFSSTGALIGVARMGNGYKPPPSTGQAMIATFRLKLAVANPSAITVVIDPQAQIAVGRQVRPFFQAVNGVANNPPGAPATGDTWVIGSAPTGAWAGFAGRIAQWIGVWSLATAPVGHVVCDVAQAIDAAGRFKRFDGAAWVNWVASEAQVGPIETATIAEHRAGVRGDAAATPLGVRAARSSRTRVKVTATGSFSWTVPANVFAVDVFAWGAGGGGGFGDAGTPPGAGGGGGAGGYAERRSQSVAPGDTITGTVGAGGAAGTAAAVNGSAGGATTLTLPGGATITCNGGLGGESVVAGAAGNRGLGGTATGGEESIQGGAGMIGIFGGSNRMYGGTGGDATYGGRGGEAGTGAANAGRAPGGGGGGSGAGLSAGAGARGEIWIEY